MYANGLTLKTDKAGTQIMKKGNTKSILRMKTQAQLLMLLLLSYSFILELYTFFNIRQ